MLADKVAAGELPPVDERLPENPFVIEGLDGVGNYGGAWRMAKKGQADGFARGQVLGRGLLNINQDLILHDYLAEAHEVSDDATVWTFHLRKGTKWSDGAPMTSEDFRFWYEDLILNREYTTAHPKWLASIVDGEVTPAEFSAPDDHTLVYTFAKPNGLLSLKGGIVRGIPAAPAHFLKPFHADYGDKAEIDAWVAGNDSWDDRTHLLADKDNANLTIDRPTHEPWLNQAVWSEEIVTLKRNPYFWEVDTAGNQLPYIDKLQYRDFTDNEVAIMRAVNGEIDCQVRHVGGFANYTVLKEGEATGDYTVLEFPCPWTDAIHFNMTTKDQRLRELFRERDFRVAASLCANREEMIELLYDGFGTPRQHVPPKESPFYSEKLANAYIDYDPDQANALLDGLGYTERDGEGYRLWQDGSGDRIAFTCLGGSSDASPFQLMMVDYLKAIGVQMNYRGVDRSLSIEMHQSNEVEVTTSQFARNLVPLADPQPWTKYTNINDRPWCNAWTAWYMDPTHPIAEKPPDGHWIWDIWAAWEAIQETADEAKHLEEWDKIMDIWVREMPSPAFQGDMPRLCPTKNGFKGIRGGYWWDCCITVYEHIIDNATWYWDEPDKHTI